MSGAAETADVVIAKGEEERGREDGWVKSERSREIKNWHFFLLRLKHVVRSLDEASRNPVSTPSYPLRVGSKGGQPCTLVHDGRHPKNPHLRPARVPLTSQTQSFRARHIRLVFKPLEPQI